MQYPNQTMAAICLALAAAFAPAQAASQRFDIPAQPLRQVLAALSQQTGAQFFYTEASLKGIPSPGVRGEYGLAEALDKALAGSGLHATFAAEKAVRISARANGGLVQLPTIDVLDVVEPGYKPGKLGVAGKVALTAREIPQSVSVVSRKQMDDQGMATVGEAMQQVTGINVIANDTTNNQYSARGYGMGVMYDGVTSYNGMTPSHQFDLPLYERVEVLRGPAGLLRGVGEPGGVVNLVKKRPKDAYALAWGASAGSSDLYRLEGDVTGPLNADKTLCGRLVLSDEQRGYFYDHTHSRKWLGLAALEYAPSPRTTFALSFAAQEQKVKAPWSGLPAYLNLGNPDAGVYPLLDVARSTFNAPDWGRMAYRTQETAASVEHRFDNQWVAKASVNHRRQSQFYKYAFTSTGVNPSNHMVSYRSFQGDYDYLRDGVDASANGPFTWFGRKHNLMFGANSEVYNSAGSSGNGPNVNNVVFGELGGVTEPAIAYTSGSESDTRQSGLYSQLRLSLADPLTLVLGGRSSTFKARTRAIAPSAQTPWKDGAKADNRFTPYGGLLYALSKDVTLYGSYADIFVPQTQAKADGGVLDPRTGRQYEVGGKGDFFDGGLAASLAVFNIRDQNRAYADPAYPTSNFFLNAGEVESRGWELEVAGQPLKGLDVVAGYTRLSTRYMKDRANEGLSYSIQTPKEQFKLWSTYRFDAASGLAGFSVGGGVIAVGAAQSSRGWRGQLLNTGYAVLNGSIAYRVDKTYSLNLVVNNLLDRKYYASVGTPNIYNFYGEPRSFLLNLRASY